MNTNHYGNVPETPLAYRPLIRRLQRRRRCVVALIIVAYVFVLFIGLPIHIELAGKVLVSLEGIGIGRFIALFFLVTVAGLLTYSSVMIPVFQSLTVACDPERSLALHRALVRNEPLRSLAVSDALFFLGRYGEAAAALGALPASIAKRCAPAMAYNRVRCAFMLGDMAALSAACAALSQACEPLLAGRGRRAAQCRLMLAEAALMQALSDTAAEDAHIRRLAAELPKTDPAQINVGFFCFLHGLAAYRLQDTEDKIYYLRRTCEIMPKTAIAAEAARYLRGISEGGEGQAL